MTKLIDSLCVVSTRGYAGRIKDSIDDDKARRGKVLAELKELRKSVSDDQIVEALAYYMSNDDVAKFVDMVRKFHGVKPSVSDSSDDEYHQFDRFNDLREEVSDKEFSNR